MVLDFGLLSSDLFGDSVANGVGIGSDEQQSVITSSNAYFKFLSVYTGSDFDTYITNGTVGGDPGTSANHTMTILPEALINAGYLFIDLSYEAAASGGSASQASLKVELATIGGAYADWIADKNVSNCSGGADSTCATVRLAHLLTDEQLREGVSVRMTSRCWKTMWSGNSAKYSNICVVLWVSNATD